MACVRRSLMQSVHPSPSGVEPVSFFALIALYSLTAIADGASCGSERTHNVAFDYGASHAAIDTFCLRTQLRHSFGEAQWKGVKLCTSSGRISLRVSVCHYGIQLFV
ncbi:hypothetical protein TRVL_10236 [Trypanosoma vivax]|nr:hypothetical protein TRVL_10236 [Trypanosoma vivax]